MIGEDKKTIKFNFKTCNSLTVDWRKIFPKVINGFDHNHNLGKTTTNYKMENIVGSYNLV